MSLSSTSHNFITLTWCSCNLHGGFYIGFQSYRPYNKNGWIHESIDGYNIGRWDGDKWMDRQMEMFVSFVSLRILFNMAFHNQLGLITTSAR